MKNTGKTEKLINSFVKPNFYPKMIFEFEVLAVTPPVSFFSTRGDPTGKVSYFDPEQTMKTRIIAHLLNILVHTY